MLSNPKYPQKPNGSPNLTNREILIGKTYPAIDILKIISPSDFEELTLEWIDGYLSKQYVLVEKYGGAGDKGRDVVGHIDINAGIWDNYQCKHYDDPLMPSQIWVEFGKIVYYTFIKDYNAPNRYFFVSPKGVGSKLADLLKDSDKLRKGLKENWDSKCKSEITKTTEVILDNALENYIDSFDFSIFDYVPQLDLINQHRETVYHAPRFGGGLIKKRPLPKLPDSNIAKDEIRYIEQLLSAYSDLQKKTIIDIKELEINYPDLFKHFNRQRVSFYSAESLHEFSRDVLPYNSNAFERLKDEIYNAVIDTCEMHYNNGYERLQNTIKQASNVSIQNNPLCNEIGTNDKKGICHHLANENKLLWI